MGLVFRSVCLISVLSIGPAANAATQESFTELLKQGAALSEEADYSGAISALKKARALAPQDYSVNLLLGVNLLRGGMPREAIEPLRVAAALYPEDAAPEGYLGKALAAVEEFALAAEAFQAAVSRSPGSPERWVEWADFDLERFRVLGLQMRTTQRGMAAVLRVAAEGLPSGAQAREALLRQSAEADPEQGSILGELGVERLQLGMREEAAAALKRARERQPKASGTLELEAMLAAAQGDWQYAEIRLLELGGRSPAALRRVLPSWPRNLVPPEDVHGAIWECARKGSLECLARIALSEGQVPRQEEQLFAEGRWERLGALPEPQGRPSAWFRRGVALAALNDCMRAIPALERGLEPGAETAAFWLELCYASEAEHAAGRVSDLGDQADAHRLRGDILVRIKGDSQSATEEYTKAIDLRPEDPGLSERLAQAYMSVGDMQRAQNAARQALSLDPHRPLALHLLASMAMTEKDYPSALVFLNRMLAIRPDAWTRVQMGIAYAQTGRPELALHHLQPPLTAGYPDERGALHAVLAGVLRKLGRAQEAQNAAEEATRLSDRFLQHPQKSIDDHQ